MHNKRRLRGVALFLLACFTSPCCTPLLVPILLALLAGTPAALWMSQHLGWVYGVLTVLSLLSFVLALRWFSQRRAAHSAAFRPSERPLLSPVGGDHAHGD